MKTVLNFIDGKFSEPISGEYLESFDPSTDQVHLKLADSNAKDVDAAVAAASRAYGLWSSLAATERSRYLCKVADLIEQELDAFALAESQDQGKPVHLAKSLDIPRAIQNFRFFAGALLHAEDEAIRTDSSTLNVISRKPVGVAGLISPWNLPLYLLTWKIAPALAFGNTVVCKPSEFTSLTAHLLCEVFVKAGLPKGVVNMVFGSGLGAGDPLVRHPNVPLISFTGGTMTGAAIATAAAPLFKKVSLELGGKNASIIFDDADLESAVEQTVRSSFLNQGEICLCAPRIYVHKQIYSEFMEKFLTQVKALKVGDPRLAVDMGPLVSRAHLEKVESYLALAREEKAQFLCGGARAKVTGRCEKGYFLEPTILTGVKAESRLQHEEIFGPIVTITLFTNENEVVTLANSTKYGLAATLWTQSLGRAHRLAERLEAGTVWINCWMVRDLRAPFGGIKGSGLGREGQKSSREFFTEAKTICIRHG